MNSTSRAPLTLLLAILLPLPAAHAQTPASLETSNQDARELADRAMRAPALAFPLRHTRVNAEIEGFVATVTVEQIFDNPYPEPIEARFTFPVPDGAAVDAMRFIAADREVEARLEAGADELEFEDPSARSVRLTQETPNLLREVIDHLAPHEEARVVTRYRQVLDEVDGELRFELPLVAGSRYTPSVGEMATLMREEERRPDRVEVSIRADFGRPVLAVTSPTHDVVVDRIDSRAVVQLATAAAPDADLDVRFTLGGTRPAVWTVASPPSDGEDGYAAFSILPDLRSDAPRRARELVFVLDASSSMRGVPLELARASVRAAIAELHPDDTVRLLTFSSAVEQLADEALPMTEDNRARLRDFLDGTRAFGPSEMTAGLLRALEAPTDPDRERAVILVSDGFVGNETDLLRSVAARLTADVRIFTLGVGSACHRYLMRHLAELGSGEALFVAPLESPSATATLLHRLIDHPTLSELRLDWGALQVLDAARLPSRAAGQPFVVQVRYQRGGRGRITLRGKLDGTAFAQPLEVTLPRSGDPRPELASLWSRAHIRDDVRSMALFSDDRTGRRIADRAMLTPLLSPFTSFVASDDGEPSALSDHLPVEQPHDRPAG